MFVPLRWRDAELLHQISHLGHVQHGVGDGSVELLFATSELGEW